MRGVVMYRPGDVRLEERADPRIVQATDVVSRVSAACVCGSDLWSYRGIEDLEWPAQMGHEYVGMVLEGGAVCLDKRPSLLRQYVSPSNPLQPGNRSNKWPPGGGGGRGIRTLDPPNDG
jgi:NADPH:quinone reductase-like Zn-dependent oxidoreductase